MLTSIIGLLGRRLFIARVRYVSVPANYLWLLLISLLLGSGIVLKMVFGGGLADAHALVSAFWRFSVPSNLSLPFAVHFLLAMLIIAMVPSSRMLHGVGLWFMPTRARIARLRSTGSGSGPN